ncbi:hypothetical protein BDZ88DRAFT_486612 [Geranomyces variabilis]|nr:hypothetical protein BDZ88DRAFT_486612 [Geranomyces variabilis]KAJ3139336.1 hypothetical protein HDU90_000702 [Geranomyces variabilis]
MRPGSQNTNGALRPPLRFLGAARRLESAVMGPAVHGATAPLNPVPPSNQNQPVSGPMTKPGNGDKPVGPETQAKERHLYPTENPTSLVRISNLASNVSENAWRNFCKQHGNVVNFRWAETHCFVEFTTASAASKVIASESGKNIAGNVIKIEFMKEGSPPKETPPDSHEEAAQASEASQDSHEEAAQSSEGPQDCHQEAAQAEAEATEESADTVWNVQASSPDVPVSTAATPPPAEKAATGAAVSEAAIGTAVVVTQESGRQRSAGVSETSERRTHAGASEQVSSGQNSTEKTAQAVAPKIARHSPPAAKTQETANVQQPSAEPRNSPAVSAHSAPVRSSTPPSTSTPDRWSALKAGQKQHANYSYAHPTGLDPKAARRVAEYHASIVPPPVDDDERRSSSPGSSSTHGINCLGDNKGGWGKPSATAEGYFGILNNISPQKRTAQGDQEPVRKDAIGKPRDDGAVTLMDGRKKQKTKERCPDDNRAPGAPTAIGQWSNLVWEGVLLFTDKQDEEFSLGHVYLVSKLYREMEMPFGDTLPFTLHEDLILQIQKILDSPQAEIFLVTSADGQCLGLPFVGEQNMLQAGLWTVDNDEAEIQLYLVPGAAFSKPPTSVAAWHRQSPDNDLQNSLVAVYLDPSVSRRSTMPGERWKLDKMFAPDHWMRSDIRMPIPTSRSTPAISSQRPQATDTRPGPVGLFPDMSDLYHIENHVDRGQPFMIFRPVNPHISATELLLHPEKFVVKEKFGYTVLPQWTEKLLASRIKTEPQEPVVAPPVQQTVGTSPAIAPAVEQPNHLLLPELALDERATSDIYAVNHPAPVQQPIASSVPATKVRQASPYARPSGNRLVPITAGSRYGHPNRQLRVAQPTPAEKPTQPVKLQMMAECKRKIDNLEAKFHNFRNVNT